MTRIVKPKSAEGRSDVAQKAIKKEPGGPRANTVWHEETVREMDDARRDKNLTEARFGRIFGILGVKHAELADKQVWKARIVFKGNSVHTKSGASATELFQAVSNPPAFLSVVTLCAARCNPSRVVNISM